MDAELRSELTAWRETGLKRKLRRMESPQQPVATVDGTRLINFSSNDYLGLAADPRLREAFIDVSSSCGLGSGASRLISGTSTPHQKLEEALAAFHVTAGALTFGCGYTAALGTLSALAAKTDMVIADRLAHACVIDAARLSGAVLRVFRHNDLDDLERLLRWADSQGALAGRRRRIVIAAESIFSMDGDVAPLAPLVQLKERYGAWLFLDEAHAVGVLGPSGGGLAAGLGLGEQIEIRMGTLGKAFGAAGGYVVGSRTLIDYLLHRARSFVFSTAPPPGVAAAALAGLDIARSVEGDERRRVLRERVHEFMHWRRGGFRGASSASPNGEGATIQALSGRSKPVRSELADFPGAIVPWMVGGEQAAVDLSEILMGDGYWVPAVRYPTVGRGKARLRVSFNARHEASHVAGLTAALEARLASAVPAASGD